MKKLFFTLLLTAFATGLVMAQEGERRRDGERRGGGDQANQMREMIKERVKSEFKLSEENADSVISYHFAFQRNTRMLDRNTDLNEANKKEKIAELNTEKTTKLKTILTDKQIKKLDEYFENMRNSMREQRQGQGGPQGIDN